MLSQCVYTFLFWLKKLSFLDELSRQSAPLRLSEKNNISCDFPISCGQLLTMSSSRIASVGTPPHHGNAEHGSGLWTSPFTRRAANLTSERRDPESRTLLEAALDSLPTPPIPGSPREMSVVRGPTRIVPEDLILRKEGQEPGTPDAL